MAEVKSINGYAVKDETARQELEKLTTEILYNANDILLQRTGNVYSLMCNGAYGENFMPNNSDTLYNLLVESIPNNTSFGIIIPILIDHAENDDFKNGFMHIASSKLYVRALGLGNHNVNSGACDYLYSTDASDQLYAEFTYFDVSTLWCNATWVK